MPKIDLKIDDSPVPILDFRNNLHTEIGYDFLKVAEDEGVTGDIEKSLSLFEKAKELLPDNKEVLF